MAFPLNTLALSAALSVDAFSQSVAILFEMNGQSTENMMRSMPISEIEHGQGGVGEIAAGGQIEVSAKDLLERRLLLERESDWSMRHSRNGMPSPRWPRMIFNLGYFSNTPLSTSRTA